MQAEAEHDASPFNMDEDHLIVLALVWFCKSVFLVIQYFKTMGEVGFSAASEASLAHFLGPKNNTAVALIVDFVAVRSGQQNFIAAEAELPKECSDY